MEKLLIIKEFPDNVKSGGAFAFNTNVKALGHFFDIEYCPITPKEPGKISKLLRLISSPIPTHYSRKEIKLISEYIKKSEAKYVFLNTSVLGYFAKVAHQCGKKVIISFQNFEYKLAKVVRSFVWVPGTKKNEYNSLKYADYCTFLHDEERKNILDFYKVDNVKYKLVPITFEDTHKSSEVKGIKPYGLFVGSFYKPNLEAIDFINEHICDHIPCDIHIVGYGLENYQINNKRNNLILVGFADDINKEYNDAAFSILPIYSGSGMKVKTCEALMHGKVIFASKEALMGYVTESKDIHHCETAEEFIQAINEYLKDIKYLSKENRDVYQKYYSNDVVIKAFKEIAEELSEK